MNGIGIPRDYANDALKKFEGDPNLAAEYLFQVLIFVFFLIFIV